MYGIILFQIVELSQQLKINKIKTVCISVFVQFVNFCTDYEFNKTVVFYLTKCIQSFAKLYIPKQIFKNTTSDIFQKIISTSLFPSAKAYFIFINVIIVHPNRYKVNDSLAKIFFKNNMNLIKLHIFSRQNQTCVEINLRHFQPGVDS